MAEGSPFLDLIRRVRAGGEAAAAELVRLCQPAIRARARVRAGDHRPRAPTMAEGCPFLDLTRRVRAGDEAAAAELVRLYEPAIRRAARVRLVDPRLRRVFDSMDVCQSVLASFFVRAALGQYELDTPEQLLRLLATMARNKLANQANRQKADRRDYRRVTGTSEDEGSPDPSPSRQV